MDLHRRKKFDAIESPNNGSCFHKLNFALINACVKLQPRTVSIRASIKLKVIPI